MGEDNGIYGIDKLAELLIARGIEFYVMDECSLIFVDGKGNPHECWRAGAEEDLVNVMIVTTPEEALSVADLNGVITENAKLRELAQEAIRAAFERCDTAWTCTNCQPYYVKAGGCPLRLVLEHARELGIEVDK